MKQELKACPFCGGAVEDAFENLWDNDEGEIEKCWTVLHSCPVLKTNVWAHADSKAEAITAWNTRTPDSVIAELVEAAQRIIDGGYVSKHIEEERADYDALTSALAKLEASK